MSDPRQVSLRILDREYRVACPPEERQSLLKAADLLNQRMEEVRDSGKLIGFERIAVMVALNLAYQSLEAETSSNKLGQAVTQRLEHLRLALAETETPPSA